MNRLVLISASSVAAVLVLFAAVLMSGVVPLPVPDDSDRPPCSQLPSRDAVKTALASHSELVTAIEVTGPDVAVALATPCAEQNDAALVSIKVDSDSERARVHDLLKNSDGFGVPAEIVTS